MEQAERWLLMYVGYLPRPVAERYNRAPGCVGAAHATPARRGQEVTEIGKDELGRIARQRGERAREIRESNGWSQTEIARRIMVALKKPEQELSRWSRLFLVSRAAVHRLAGNCVACWKRCRVKA
jgi:hypothetical protein